MKAIIIEQPGPCSQLIWGDHPTPSPGFGEVLVKVMAAGLNRGDLLQRQGHYPPPPGASDIPGLEIAGTVIGLGAGVHDLEIGVRVCALMTGGGYAEYATVAASLCFKMPDTMDYMQAAALPEALFTVWDNVFRRGRLQSGESLLVQGGTSGIGSLAIPMALRWGAKVIATAGSDEKCDFLRGLGASAINYRTEDLLKRCIEINDGQGIDVILDLVGAAYLQDHLTLLATEGRLVIIAVQGGHRSELSLLPILTKRLTITGSTLRARSLEEKTVLANEIREQIWPWIVTGELRPTLAARFPLHDADQAQKLMASGTHIGKIILEPHT